MSTATRTTPSIGRDDEIPLRAPITSPIITAGTRLGHCRNAPVSTTRMFALGWHVLTEQRLYRMSERRVKGSALVLPTRSCQGQCPTKPTLKNTSGRPLTRTFDTLRRGGTLPDR
jgi:hypothetical protein